MSFATDCRGFMDFTVAEVAEGVVRGDSFVVVNGVSVEDFALLVRSCFFHDARYVAFSIDDHGGYRFSIAGKNFMGGAIYVDHRYVSKVADVVVDVLRRWVGVIDAGNMGLILEDMERTCESGNSPMKMLDVATIDVKISELVASLSPCVDMAPEDIVQDGKVVVDVENYCARFSRDIDELKDLLALRSRTTQTAPMKH